METVHVVEIVLVSILVGASLPVLFQLRATLGAFQRRLNGTADRLDRALDGIGVAADRLNRATDALEDGRRMRELMEAIDILSRAANQLRRTAQVGTAVGAAVGPALAAAVRALRSPPPQDSRLDGHGSAVGHAQQSA